MCSYRGSLSSSRLNFPTEKQLLVEPIARARYAKRVVTHQISRTFQALRGRPARRWTTWHKRCVSPGQANSLERQAFETEEGGEKTWCHRHRAAGASPGRCAADLALQQQLGLLSERRLGAGASDRADPCSHRTDLESRPS